MMDLSFNDYERIRRDRLVDGLQWGKFETHLFRPSVAQAINKVRVDVVPALALDATSYGARLRWHRAFAKHLSEALDEPEHGTLARFLTLIDARERYEWASEHPTIGHLRHHFGRVLRGLSFVGMLEPALYVSLPRELFTGRRLFIWHFHGVVWGATQANFDEARVAVRRQGFRTLLPGAPALLSEAIKPDELGRVVGYINKSPTHQYSLVRRRPGTKMKQYRRTATGANLARLHRHLEGLYLDQLSLAGGEGEAVLKLIKADALKDWRDRNRRSLRHH